MLQDQCDNASKTPPWNQSNTFDIDNRPVKKRKKWYYEVVSSDGRVVDVIDDDLPQQRSKEINSRHYSSPRKSEGSAENIYGFSSSNIPTHEIDTACSIHGTSSFSDQNGQQHDCKSSVTHEVTSLKSIEREDTCNNKLGIRRQFPAHHYPETIEAGSTCSYFLKNHPQKKSTGFTNLIKNERIEKFKPVSEFNSTSSGIESSLSSQLSHSPPRMISKLKGRDLFDAMIWSDPFKASIFFMFMTSFREKVKLVKSTSETHRFFKVLRDSGRLVRTYTQNIDCLEEKVGLTTDLTLGPGNRARFQTKNQRVALPENPPRHSNHFRGVEAVLLHGSLDALRCGVCTRRCDWDEDNRTDMTSKGTAPDCPYCTANNSKRNQVGRRVLTVGRLRPDIVLYGEEHPNSSLIYPVVTHDLSLGPDLLLIMGTSLKVHGFKVMIKEFAKAVHSRGGKVLFVNQTGPPESIWTDIIDYWINWDCDKWVLDLKVRRKDIWLPQAALNEKNIKSRSKIHPNISTKKRNGINAICEDKSNGAYLVSKIMRLLAREISELPNKGEKKVFKRRSFRSYAKKPTLPIKLAKITLFPRRFENFFSVKSSQKSLKQRDAQSKYSDEPIASRTLSSYISKTWSKYWADFCEK